MPIIKKIKRKYRLYRQFETDIWGNNVINLNNSNICRFIILLYLEKMDSSENKEEYFYRVDFMEPKRKPKKREWRFLRLKRLKLYYWFLGHKQMISLDRKARRKEGPCLSHFILCIESRLSVLVYRFILYPIYFMLRNFYCKNL